MIDLSVFRKQEFARRDANLKYITPQTLIEQSFNNKNLHITYVLTHVGICGGTKIIFEHVNYLCRYKHKVTLVAHFDKPTWFPLDPKVQYVQVPFTQELTMGITECDLIVATYWREIAECIARNVAPVVYFEQGDYHLFAWDKVSKKEKDHIYKQLQLPVFIYTVSKGAATQLKKIFNREATIIHNGINDRIFYASDRDSQQRRNIVITTIGSEHNTFKGIQGIKEAITKLNDRDYHIQFNWITPDQPKEKMGYVYVNPRQGKIGELLRKSDIYIANSSYESFSLPVLEAMACGCAVISTKNKGVIEYAVDQVNCLMINMDDPDDIIEKVIRLVNDKKLKQHLIDEGLKTADKFSWKNIIPKLIDYYRTIARYRVVIDKEKV